MATLLERVQAAWATGDPLALHREVEQLAAEEPNFHYICTLSRPPESWSGARGYVQEHVRKIVAGRQDMHVYICGLNEMVSSKREQIVHAADHYTLSACAFRLIRSTSGAPSCVEPCDSPGRSGSISSSLSLVKTGIIAVSGTR